MVKKRKKLSKKRIFVLYLCAKITSKIDMFSNLDTPILKNVNNSEYQIVKQDTNNNSSWSNKPYWGGTMSENGCGITAISTILSGYNKNYTPEDLRQKYYPVLDNETISKELSNTFHIKNTDFFYDSVHLSKAKFLLIMLKHFICIINNFFT